MAQQEQQILVIVLQSNTAADPNNQWAQQVASLVNGRQNSIVVTSEISQPIASNLSIIYEDGDGSAPYGPVAWFDPALDHQGTKMSIDLTFYREKRISMPQEYYLCYFISIIVFELVFSMARNGKKLRVLKPHEFDQVNDLVWRGSLPESAKNTLFNLTNSLSQGLYRGFLDASTQILLIGQAVAHQVSEDARVVSDFLSGLSMSGIGDIYPQVRRKLIQWGPQASGRLEGSFSSADPKAIPLFIDFLEATPNEDSLYLLRAIAAAENIDDEPKSRAAMAFERITKGKPRTLDHLLRGNEPAATPEPASAVGSTVGPELAQITADASIASPHETKIGNLQHKIRSLQRQILDPVVPTNIGLLREELEVARNELRRLRAGKTDQPENPQEENVGKSSVSQTVDLRRDVKEASGTAGSYGVAGDHTPVIDSLGYTEYAKALAQVIANKNSKPPLTIGICAPWGRGKSTLMELIEKELGNINDQLARNPHPDYRRSKTLWFDAWRYSKAEQIWAGFIDSILRDLQKDFGWWHKKWLAVKWNRTLDLPLVRQLAILTVGAVITLIILLSSRTTGVTEVGLVVWVVGVVVILKKYVGGIWRLASSPITERIAQLTQLPDYKSRLDPIHKIIEDLEMISKEYTKKHVKRPAERFVVFVDDIDRCIPDKIMETLEAMKHFLSMEQFVFVIAMDARVVRLAIGEHYRFMGSDPNQCEEMGRFYLEKILQIPFSLRKVSGERLKDLNKVLLADYLAKEAPASKTKLSTPDINIDKTIPVTPVPETSGGMLGGSKLLPLGSAPNAAEPAPAVPAVAGIGSSESRTIYGILETPGMELSPRLFKRFINIYLIARDLYFTQQAGMEKQVTPPDPSMTRWLALSVAYPFETKVLLRWFEEHNWGDPLKEYDAPLSGAWLPTGVDAAAACRWSHFRPLYVGLGIDHKVVQKTKRITDCFNLVLD